MYISVYRVVRQFFWSLRHARDEFHVGWYWKRDDRAESGYHEIYYDGLNCALWVGPLCISWRY